MNEPNTTQSPETQELDETQVEEVGGGDICTPGQILAITESLTQSYENLVGFASHVIERVAGGTNS